MAEGDTILRLARRIDQALAGRVVAVRTPHPRGRSAGIERLDGATLLGTAARGKNLLVHFRLSSSAQGSSSTSSSGMDRSLDEGSGELVLHSHLGMSGGWHLYRPGECWRRSEHSAWVVASAPAVSDASVGAPHDVAAAATPNLDVGIDLVQFGGPTLRLLRPDQVRRDPTLTSLGPDILGPEPFDLNEVIASVRSAGPEATLGEAVLDQRAVAGIGNIFKSEGCFAARKDPWRRLGEVDDEELGAILGATREMMLASVEGASRPRQVYRRAGEPCRRCGGRILSGGQGEANRTTYWCRGCQS